jgi:hypothetical protein
LRIRIPAAKSDCRTHIKQINQHQMTIADCMNQLGPILAKIGGDVMKAIQTRGKTLNARFETSTKRARRRWMCFRSSSMT